MPSASDCSCQSATSRADARVVPAELAAERGGHRPRALGVRRAQRPRVEQPEPGAAQQHVGDRAGLLVASREHRLGQQVRLAGHDRAAQVRALLGEGEQLARGVAVAVGEQRVARVVDPVDVRHLLGIDRQAERDLVRAAGRLAALALDDPVDRQLRHPPPGRELAAGDRDQAGARLEQLRAARDVDGLLVVAQRDQRPHARVRAGHVREPEVAGRRSCGRPRAGTPRPSCSA